jgi:hypothetical protein
MDISEVRRRVVDTIARARRHEAERRVRADEASRDYEVFLEQTAVPLVRQVANALKAEGYPFAVFTPGGGVRLVSERSADDYIELSLDTAADEPAVVGHTRRTRGRHVMDAERPLGAGPIRDLGEAELLGFLLQELEALLRK